MDALKRWWTSSANKLYAAEPVYLTSRSQSSGALASLSRTGEKPWRRASHTHPHRGLYLKRRTSVCGSKTQNVSESVNLFGSSNFRPVTHEVAERSKLLLAGPLALSNVTAINTHSGIDTAPPPPPPHTHTHTPIWGLYCSTQTFYT